ncbi:hypothetical protein AB4144_03245 [Rhizobiaceae sp. 2RAB30]
MFHTYVLAASGNQIDIDRASFLMDEELLQNSIDAMKEEMATLPQEDALYGPQWIWGYYCERHAEKYGKCFEPDVSPDWDQGGTPARKALEITPQEIEEFLAGLPLRGRKQPEQT